MSGCMYVGQRDLSGTRVEGKESGVRDICRECSMRRINTGKS